MSLSSISVFTRWPTLGVHVDGRFSQGGKRIFMTFYEKQKQNSLLLLRSACKKMNKETPSIFMRYSEWDIFMRSLGILWKIIFHFSEMMSATCIMALVTFMQSLFWNSPYQLVICATLRMTGERFLFIQFQISWWLERFLCMFLNWFLDILS